MGKNKLSKDRKYWRLIIHRPNIITTNDAILCYAKQQLTGWLNNSGGLTNSLRPFDALTMIKIQHGMSGQSITTIGWAIERKTTWEWLVKYHIIHTFCFTVCTVNSWTDTKEQCPQWWPGDQVREWYKLIHTFIHSFIHSLACAENGRR